MCAQAQDKIYRKNVAGQCLDAVEMDNSIEAVKDPVREGICAPGISRDQVQPGNCVIPYSYETFRCDTEDVRGRL